jgi:hypothetical protein
MRDVVLIRGGGDLASGVGLRLMRAGIQVVIAELPEPRAVRRTVAFSEAIFVGETRIENRLARRSDPRAAGTCGVRFRSGRSRCAILLRRLRDVGMHACQSVPPVARRRPGHHKRASSEA